MTSCWPTPEQWKASESEVNVPTLKAEQTCIAGDIRSVEERLAAVDAHLGRVGGGAQPGNALRHQLRPRLQASERENPSAIQPSRVPRGSRCVTDASPTWTATSHSTCSSTRLSSKTGILWRRSDSNR